jgi:RNA polymerase sigma-70 factor (ECF subfamily)
MSSAATRRFFHLFMANQNRVYAYILVFVPHGPDADDIMQEVATVMWERFETFTPGTDFARWAKRIAYHKILDHRKKRGRRRVVFSDELFQLLAEQAEAVLDETDPRLEALRFCLRRLRDQDRRLVRQHYEDGVTIKRMAERAQRSVEGLYKVMVRIHNRLRDCVNMRLTSQGMVE